MPIKWQNQSNEKSAILDESTILDNNCNPQRTLSTILDNVNVQLSGANTISLTIDSITPTTQSTGIDASQQTGDQSQTCTSGEKVPKSKPSNDRHEWDEQTFRQRVSAAFC